MTSAGKNRFFRDFWEAPHRPLFSAAILCALVVVAWWPLGARLGLPSPGLEPLIVWHVHELIFGFAGAAIGGYLLTALPGWTRLPPVRGNVLKALLMFWVSARLAMALASHVPNTLLATLNAGYFLLLAGIIGHQMLSTGVYRKLGFPVAVVALVVGEVLFLRATLAGSPWVSLSMVQPLLIGLIVLMVSVGTRAIPAFTQNWLSLNRYKTRASQSSTMSVVSAQALLVIAIVTKLIGQHDTAYVAMIGAGLALLWNMRGWQSLSALSNPLLAALHLAFFWLPFGLMGVGVSGLAPAIYPMADALHTITIGGMSGLIMAISGRAAAHTKSGDMRTNPGFTVGFLLVWIATWVRLAAPIFPGQSFALLAAAIWCTAWIAFALGFLPALTGPLRRPVLSGRRHGELAEISKAERMG